MRRMVSFDRLPLPGVFLHGPRWRRHFDVKEVAQSLPLEDGRRALSLVLVYDFEADVRERIVEELRPSVAAMWTDPRERLGL